MKPVTQTIFHDDSEGRTGNCFASCIASVLELALGSVPNFMENDSYRESINEFLEPYNLRHEEIGLGFEWVEHLKDFVIVGGKSPRGTFNHSVIYRNGELVHDPHPSGEGIVGPMIDRDTYMVSFLTVIDPAKMREGTL